MLAYFFTFCYNITADTQKSWHSVCVIHTICQVLAKEIFVSPELCSERDYMITHSVCSMCVVCSMYVVICKIDHYIHIHWCIPMGLGHNDPWVESHMWPLQMWGQRSSRGQWPLVQVFARRVTVSTYFDVFSWDLDTIIPTDVGSKVI